MTSMCGYTKRNINRARQAGHSEQKGRVGTVGCATILISVSRSFICPAFSSNTKQSCKMCLWPSLCAVELWTRYNVWIFLCRLPPPPPDSGVTQHTGVSCLGPLPVQSSTSSHFTPSSAPYRHSCTLWVIRRLKRSPVVETHN